MSLTIDATVGGTAANSYATEAEALAYFEAKPAFYTVWTGLTDAQRRAELIEAARAIDRLPIRYGKCDPAQALAFPRTVNPDLPVYLSLTPTAIDSRVKQAQLEMVIYLRNAGTEAGGQPARAVNNIDIDGVLSLEFADVGLSTATRGEAFPGGEKAVLSLLAPWLAGANGFSIVK